MLVDKNILMDRTAETYVVFTNHITADFLNDPSLPRSMAPSAYVTECWNRYKAAPGGNNSLNGKIFEVIIATALYRNGVHPFYLQARAELVPDVDYDIIMYDAENNIPITISVKTTARERYKQADLEAYAFKNVHRSSLNYLLMLDENECRRIQAKINAGVMLGLKQAIRADTSEFDDFVSGLKARKLGASPTITLFSGQEVE